MFNLFIYIGITPVIAFAAKAGINHLMSVIFAFVLGYSSMFTSGSKLLLNIYPVTAGLSVIGFRGYNPAVGNMFNPSLSVVSLILTAFLTFCIVVSTTQTEKTQRKTKSKPRRGW
ncbi:hypothetical protein ODU73_000904 [Thermoclostridium stercorarium]|uniref:hypothetical protein n=1 Tax=Thermoclostridium stercorarium TaxID=1510 RepID=UPI001181B58F|nr:hypothetical protein [Thermoclostridium stercorarium]UZQ86455.1 hypothetical protein ODU73_000904 [Thermoclostridium stercorarium]